MLLSTAYFPPIEYFALMAKCSIVYMEGCESYAKQSYRNRCRILTANGVEDLRVPIVHGPSKLITDICVDYKTPWVRQSEYAIESAYYNSPFFEYYKDELFAILDAHPERLWDLNLQIIEFFCRKIGIAPQIVRTSDFTIHSDDAQDHRFSIHPKRDSSYEARPYYQVFRDKWGFVPNLSIMDLLFNEGPESICYL